jgi:hypothetical protein
MPLTNALLFSAFNVSLISSYQANAIEELLLKSYCYYLFMIVQSFANMTVSTTFEKDVSKAIGL